MTMNYLSTRNKDLRLSASQAIAKGLAPDGGLLTPAVLPRLPSSAVETMREMSYQQRVVYIMNSFLEGFAASELNSYASEAYGGGKFSHEDIAPVRKLDESTYCLELWHGPTCAFKDMALQILPHLLTASLDKNDEKKTVCILVATSGDTGKAALEGFRNVENTKILVFYPKDGVSEIQELQMVTQEGGNVGVSSVVGNFDDAQTGVKKLFADEKLAAELRERGYFLSSANSINWGRVLPQIVYYASAYCDLLKEGAIAKGQQVNICVPTGNFGNILAAYYAKAMGIPIGRLICASNQNNVLTDFIHTGSYDRNRTFYNTLSPSMDILVSSNLERMVFELSGRDDRLVREYMSQLAQYGSYRVDSSIRTKLKKEFSAGCCSDEQTKAMIAKMWGECGYLIDPHTAVAMNVCRQYRKETGDETRTIVLSTASPYKFGDTVLAALGEDCPGDDFARLSALEQISGLPVPAALSTLKDAPVRFGEVCAPEEMGDKVLEFLG